MANTRDSHGNGQGIISPTFISPEGWRILAGDNIPGNAPASLHPEGDLCKSIERVEEVNRQKAMQPKRDRQTSFFDLALQQRGATNKVLDTINREVDFSAAEQQVAATYRTGGRPACPVGVLLRIMILQHIYNLSDPQAEEQLRDRLS